MTCSCGDFDYLRVDGACYLHEKAAAGLLEAEGFTGSGLSDEQRTFVGLTGTPRSDDGWSAPRESAYPPTLLERRMDSLREERQTLRVLMSARTAQQIAGGTP